MKRLFSFAAMAASLVLVGCATQVQFESSPPGAQVTYVGKGMVLGTTPFDMTINDDFGWFSVYRFIATLEGHEPVIVEFAERTPLDAQQVIPPVVRFDFKKPAVAVAQAASEPAKAE